MGLGPYQLILPLILPQPTCKSSWIYCRCTKLAGNNSTSKEASPAIDSKLWVIPMGNYSHKRCAGVTNEECALALWRCWELGQSQHTNAEQLALSDYILSTHLAFPTPCPPLTPAFHAHRLPSSMQSSMKRKSTARTCLKNTLSSPCFSQ